MKNRKFLLPLAVLAAGFNSETTQASVNLESTNNDKNLASNPAESFEKSTFNFEDKSALSFVLKKNDQGVVYADHASHSSHASHRSHSSGY